jgi:WD40 repeat protein
VFGRPGALPLLSMALLATWERREGRTLTLAGYRAAGGVASAVAEAAEECFGALAPGAQRAARRLLLQLAGEQHGVDVRRRVPIVAVGVDDADTRAALDRLVARRLVIVDEDVAEVAHEALFRDWPRLAAWLDEDRSGRQLRERLAADATVWIEGGQDESELYRGTRLDAAVEWSDRHGEDLAPLEREFLARSRDAATRELRVAQERVRRERRKSRRLRVALAGIAVLLVVALVAGGLALRANDEADASALRADANRLAGLASSEPLLKNALLDAVEGVRLHDSAETRTGLADALQRTPRALRIEQLRQRGYMILSPSADVIAIQSYEPRDRFYDAKTLAPKGSLPSDAAIGMLSDDRVATVRFTQTDDSRRPPQYDIVLRSLSDPQVKDRYGGGSGSVTAVVGSLQSRVVYAAGLRATTSPTGPAVDAYVDAWSLDSPGTGPIARYAVSIPRGPLWGRTTSIALSPDGGVLYVSRAFSPTIALDARSLEPRATLPPVGDFDAAALSADGRRLAVAGEHSIDVIDTATGDHVTTVEQPSSARLIDYTLDPTGAKLAVGDSAGAITIWSLDGEPSRQLELTGPRDQVGGVFSPDGRDFWAFSLDGSLVRWDVEGGRGIVRHVMAGGNHGLGDLRGYVLSPDLLVQFIAFDKGNVLRDLRTGVSKPFPLDAPDQLGPLSFSPDDSSLYGISQANGTLYKFDVPTGKLVTTGTPNAAAGPFIDMVVSRGGVVAVFTPQGIARFDATTLAPLSPIDLDMTGIPLGGIRLALAPDGRSIAVLRHRLPFATDAQLGFTEGVGEESIVFIDLSRGRQTGEMRVAEHTTALEYAPDGSLAVGTTTGRVLLVDPRTRSVTGRSARNVADGFVGDMLFTDYGLAVSRRNGFVVLLDRETLRVVGAPVQESVAGGGSGLALRGRHELLIAYESNGLVTSFDLRSSALLEHACRVAASGLSERQWRDVLPDRQPTPPCPGR